MKRKPRKDENGHTCNIGDRSSMSFLPKITTRASIFKRIGRYFKKNTLISDSNPQSMEYYRSRYEICRMRRAHVDADTCIIHPFSNFRVYYEMWMSVVLLTVLFYFPMDAAFDWVNAVFVYDYSSQYEYVRENSDYFEICLRIFCLIDIVVTFFTGYPLPARHKVIMKPKKIALHYLFGPHFVLDVLTSVPLEGFVEGSYTQRALDFFLVLKIFRLSTLDHYLSNTLDYFRVRLTIIRILKNIVIHFMIFHCFACLTFLTPQVRYVSTGKILSQSWVERRDLPQRGIGTKYVTSFYRSTACLLSINYQRFDVELPEEMLIATITYVFGKIYVCYMTVHILNYLLRCNSLETKYYEVISQVKAYMIKKQLPAAMQARLLQFYDYKYNQTFFKEKRIIGLLSDNLKKEINLSICSKLVEDVNLLGQLPQKVLEQVVVNLKPEIYLPNDVIIKAGSVGEYMYFLASGTVAVWTPSGKEVCHLEDGAYFGEISLVYKDKRRTANIVALETCEVYKLHRKVFKNCFKSNPDLLKMLEDVANERLEITQVYEDAHAQTFLEL